MQLNKDTAIPPCEIRIDKEGTWYYRGAEMFRKDIVNYFYENLKIDENGRYLIEIDEDRCYLDVEDTVFVVKAVHLNSSEIELNNGIISLLLSDDTSESLDLDTLCVGADNVPYCKVKNRRFDARFSKAGYYQLARFVEYDSERDTYYISLAGTCTYIRRCKSEIK